MRADELCHALAVEMGSRDLDPNNIPVLRTLLSSCLGLVNVEASSSTVRLVHFTLQEHLLSNSTLFPSPHSTIAEVCLTYLNFGWVRDRSWSTYPPPQTAALIKYASLYWGKHARMGMTEDVKILALRLLNTFDEHISSRLLLLHYNKCELWNLFYHPMPRPTGFTGLHGAAFLGMAEILATLLEMKESDVNAYDCVGNTALTWGARNGHEEVVKMLLEREGVNPAGALDGRMPLSWAAEKGHEGLVKMLLERKDVNPSQADTGGGQTPLSRAAANGHVGVVKMLLEREDVNPDLADTEYGRTPISWAAENGHVGVVKILLEREDVNPDLADTEYGRTALSLAAESGHGRVVKMLWNGRTSIPTWQTPSIAELQSCGRQSRGTRGL